MRVKPVRVYLPADEREAAEMFAAEQNRSVSNLLRHALSGYMVRYHRRPGNRALRVHGEALQGTERREP